MTRRLAVLGSPIAHSKSPMLHGAAYRLLGLDWRYDRVEMTSGALAGFLDSCGPEWKGLSVTMPVKHAVIPLLDVRDRLVEFTGVCNTVLFDGRGRVGFNTDIHGIEQAFRDAGVDSIDHALILGNGATATSALAAAGGLGASRVTVAARDPLRAEPLSALGPRLGVAVDVIRLGDKPADEPDAVISTLPNGVDLSLVFDGGLMTSATLFDVAYEPWPSTLAAAWMGVGGRVVSGLEMLVHQAVMQVRVFTTGSPDTPLSDELSIVDAMRAAVSG